MRRFAIILSYVLSLTLSLQVYATEYQFLQYRVADGLIADFVKCISQDDKGFIWIGTDEGLVQYNGDKFINYPQATKSPFIKQFLKLRDGRLLVLDDLGLNEIINQVDTVLFKPVIIGTRNLTDSTLRYPKSVFEDSYGNIWVGEPQSVVKYDGKKLQRFQFSAEHSSSSFIRSFSFVELPNHQILISSYSGGFFLYDNETDSLTALKNDDFSGDISAMLLWNNQVYIGCNYGVYIITSIEGNEVKTKQIKRNVSVSHFLPLNANELLISSFLSEPLIYTPGQGYQSMQYPIIAVNQAYLSDKGNIWMATEKGLVLLTPEIFRTVNIGNENTYIESVCLGKDNSQVYFASKEHIHTYESGDSIASVFHVHNRGYYLSMKVTGDSLWASNANQIILYSTSGSILSQWDFSKYGRYIFDIDLDRDHNLWFTQEAAIELKMIDRSGIIHIYGPSKGITEELTVVRMSDKGIYVGTSSKKDYLFYKSYEDSVFTNMSLPIDIKTSKGFKVEDIAIDEDEHIWFATSVGVLVQSGNSIKRLNVDARIYDQPIKLIVIQKGSPYVWFSTAYGLVQYNKETGEHNIYDESYGLPSNAINSGGLIMGDQVMWVGTAGGLAYSHYNFQDLKQTPEPYIVKFIADDKQYLFNSLNENKLPPHPNVEIYVSSPCYPSGKVRYQYKMIGKEGDWTDLPKGGIISLSKLNGGTYDLLVRAKKYGNYNWSTPGELKFRVNKAFHETVYFVFAIILLAIFIIYITRVATTRILRRRQQELERIVALRTAELAKANKALLSRNQELDQFVYSTSHDLSAPLKSIRGLINIAGLETDPEERISLLKRMDGSALKLEKFIKDVISYSRNARLEIQKQPIKLRDLVEEILNNISNFEGFDKIKIELDIPPELVVESDETRLKIILNNLLSNAVKFQKPDEIDPQVTIAFKEENTYYKVIVSDNGQGIPKQYLEKIFNMFYRANVSSEGSGLGLYILKDTVQKLSGEVLVESIEGEGSVFTIHLPK